LNWIAEDDRRGEKRRAFWPETGDGQRARWLLAAAFFSFNGGWRRSLVAGKQQAPTPMYFHTSVPFPANDLALSPDGRDAAMVAYSEQANNYVLCDV